MQFAPAPEHGIPVLPEDGHTIVPIPYTMDVWGLGWKILGLQRFNTVTPVSGFIVYIRVLWYNNSITTTSFIIPPDTNLLILIGRKPDGQVYSIREYLVVQ
jgi:hypothetical protein